MKIKLMLCIVTLALAMILSACRPPVEEMSTIDPGYSIDDVNSFLVKLDCIDADVTELKETFEKDYCLFLKNQIVSTIQQQHPQWQLAEQKPDLLIEAELEQLYGGNQVLRFFLPIEAGRTMLTIHFSLYKKALLVAERRLTEITRRIHFEDEKYTNEEAITEDSKIVAMQISDFIDQPAEFDKKLKDYRDGYNPH
jgi:hypothetical protein